MEVACVESQLSLSVSYHSGCFQFAVFIWALFSQYYCMFISCVLSAFTWLILSAVLRHWFGVSVTHLSCFRLSILPALGLFLVPPFVYCESPGLWFCRIVGNKRHRCSTRLSLDFSTPYPWMNPGLCNKVFLWVLAHSINLKIGNESINERDKFH